MNKEQDRIDTLYIILEGIKAAVVLSPFIFLFVKGI